MSVSYYLYIHSSINISSWISLFVLLIRLMLRSCELGIYQH